MPSGIGKYIDSNGLDVALMNCEIYGPISLNQIFRGKLMKIEMEAYITAWKVSVFGVFLVRMQENADQKNAEYGHFSCSAYSFYLAVNCTFLNEFFR